MEATTDPSPPAFCLRGGEASSVPPSSAMVSGGRGKFSGGKSGDACDASSWGDPKMVEEKIDGAFEFRGGRQIRCFDLRRKREAVVTRCPRNTCTLDGEDGNTCPSSREVDLRGGEVNRVKGLGFSSSWARGPHISSPIVRPGKAAVPLSLIPHAILLIIEI
ncbi:hypothetical protein YC2023_055996 [Brassica napus]